MPSPPNPGGRSALGPPPAEAGGILTIDLAALVSNWRQLQARVTPATCAAVVKADGYGCGLAPVTSTLQAAGCKVFFVANCQEGRAVRQLAKTAVIYVLNGLAPGTAAAYAQANLRPVLGSLAELEEWAAYRVEAGWQGGAALHVDTGMNRLGLTLREAHQVAARKAPSISLLITHFCCADLPQHPLNAQQIAAFAALRRQFPDIPGSLANSSGIFLGPETHHDLVRAGAALYGANPTPGRPNPMRPVVRLEGRIVQTRKVACGQSVGYGSAWTAKRPSRIVVVAIGYGDGVLRAAGASDSKPGAQAIVAGRRCPLAGRISMDLTAIDVTDLPDKAAQRGEFVRFLDAEIGVDELGAHAGTIGYEVLTSLGRRYCRVYAGAERTNPEPPVDW